MINLAELTIQKTQKMIQDREISIREFVSVYQENIKEKNKDVNAYLENFNDAFEIAEKQDKRILSGESLKPLTGISFAIKDNILIKGKIASAASKMLENYKATYDSTVIKKLRDAGAIFLGRTNMDEFAMGSSTENSAFGPTKNPYDSERVSGGSSGGSAASVAADLSLVALGSDTAGSIRQPAGFCGVVGLNPTYGAVSRYGLIAMGSSFDQIGPIAKTVEDVEIIFNIIKGLDEMDSTSIESHTQDSRLKTQDSLKIGVLKYDKRGVDEDVVEIINNSVKLLKKLGHEIQEIDLPYIEYSVSCYYILVFAEISANLARFDGVKYGFSKKGKNLLEDYLETRANGFGKEVRRRIMLGTYILSSGYYDEYYSKAQKTRVIIKKDFKQAFDNDVDVILTPISPTPAFKIGEKSDDSLQMYLEDIFTAPAKLAGIPAISVPAGFVERDGKRLPIGVQIMAPWFKEETLFYLGKQIENYGG